MAHSGDERVGGDEGEHEAAQIYLIADVGPTTAERLAAACDGAAVATVLLVAPEGGSFAAAEVKTLVEAVQARGIAVLIADDAALARTVRADGVHLSAGIDGVARYGEARDILGTRYIVGVEASGNGGDVRHEAMSLGEAGADYVAFGGAGAGSLAGEDLLDGIDWWSEIFEVPCVGFAAATPEEARALAEAGAEFVAVRLPRGAAAADVKAAMQAFDAALALDGAVVSG